MKEPKTSLSGFLARKGRSALASPRQDADSGPSLHPQDWYFNCITTVLRKRQDIDETSCKNPSLRTEDLLHLRILVGIENFALSQEEGLQVDPAFASQNCFNVVPMAAGRGPLVSWGKGVNLQVAEAHRAHTSRIQRPVDLRAGLPCGPLEGS